jgi:hypothetical protein
MSNLSAWAVWKSMNDLKMDSKDLNPLSIVSTR